MLSGVVAAEPHSWRQAGAALATAAGTTSILFIFIFILPQCKINLTREIDEGASALENFSVRMLFVSSLYFADPDKILFDVFYYLEK